MASFGMTTTIRSPFDAAKKRVTEALATQGFGVLTEIDISATLESKMGAVIEPYQILGACNPALAHKALEADRSIGLLLPCNVTLRQVEDGVEVSILDPEAMFGVAGPELRSQLGDLVDDARGRLARVIEVLN